MDTIGILMNIMVAFTDMVIIIIIYPEIVDGEIGEEIEVIETVDTIDIMIIIIMIMI